MRGMGLGRWRGCILLVGLTISCAVLLYLCSLSFSGEYHEDTLPASRTLPVILRSESTWGDLLGYLRTWSSLNTYHAKYPEDLGHEEGDVAVRFWNALRQLTGKDVEPNEALTIEWPIALVLTKKTRR